MPLNDQIEQRDAKEIEIERTSQRIIRTTKEGKATNPEKKETVPKENKPKSEKIISNFINIIIVSFFTYNLTILFLEDILREVPFRA